MNLARQHLILLLRQGKKEEAEAFKKSIERKAGIFQKLKVVFQMYEQQKNAAMGTNAPNNVSTTANTGSNQTTNANPGLPQASSAPQQLQPQAQARPQQVMPGQGGASSGPPGGMQMNASVAAQMQKLVGREGIQGQSLMASSMAQATLQNAQQRPPVVAQAGNQPLNNQMQAEAHGRRWIGVVSWFNPQTNDRGEAAVEFIGIRDMCVWFDSTYDSC